MVAITALLFTILAVQAVKMSDVLPEPKTNDVATGSSSNTGENTFGGFNTLITFLDTVVELLKDETKTEVDKAFKEAEETLGNIRAILASSANDNDPIVKSAAEKIIAKISKLPALFDNDVNPVEDVKKAREEALDFFRNIRHDLHSALYQNSDNIAKQIKVVAGLLTTSLQKDLLSDHIAPRVFCLYVVDLEAIVGLLLDVDQNESGEIDKSVPTILENVKNVTESLEAICMNRDEPNNENELRLRKDLQDVSSEFLLIVEKYFDQLPEGTVQDTFKTGLIKYITVSYNFLGQIEDLFRTPATDQDTITIVTHSHILESDLVAAIQSFALVSADGNRTIRELGLDLKGGLDHVAGSFKSYGEEETGNLAGVANNMAEKIKSDFMMLRQVALNTGLYSSATVKLHYLDTVESATQTLHEFLYQPEYNKDDKKLGAILSDYVSVLKGQLVAFQSIGQSKMGDQHPYAAAVQIQVVTNNLALYLHDIPLYGESSKQNVHSLKTKVERCFDKIIQRLENEVVINSNVKRDIFYGVLKNLKNIHADLSNLSAEDNTLYTICHAINVAIQKVVLEFKTLAWFAKPSQENRSGHAIALGDSIEYSNPCSPSPCGPNSNCRVLHENPVCSCQQNYIGMPPRCRPECMISTDCSREIKIPVEESLNPCTPSPCGANAVCKEVHGVASCWCIPDYFGDPYTGCRPECVTHSDCPKEKACINNKCIDPCYGTCGSNTECDVNNHTPSCSCLSGYSGDPLTECQLLPAKDEGNFEIVTKSVLVEYLICLRHTQHEVSDIISDIQQNQNPRELATQIQANSRDLIAMFRNVLPGEEQIQPVLFWPSQKFALALSHISTKLKVQNVNALETSFTLIQQSLMGAGMSTGDFESETITQLIQLIRISLETATDEMLNLALGDKNPAFVKSVMHDFLASLRCYHVELQTNLQLFEGESTGAQLQVSAVMLLDQVLVIELESDDDKFNSILVTVLKELNTIKISLGMIPTDFVKLEEDVQVKKLCHQLSDDIRNISREVQLILKKEKPVPQVPNDNTKYTPQEVAAWVLKTFANNLVQLAIVDGRAMQQLNNKERAAEIQTITDQLPSSIERVDETKKELAQGLVIEAITYAHHVENIVKALENELKSTTTKNDALQKATTSFKAIPSALRQVYSAWKTKPVSELKTVIIAQAQSFNTEIKKLLEAKLEDSVLGGVLVDYLDAIKQLKIGTGILHSLSKRGLISNIRYVNDQITLKTQHIMLDVELFNKSPKFNAKASQIEDISKILTKITNKIENQNVLKEFVEPLKEMQALVQELIDGSKDVQRSFRRAVDILQKASHHIVKMNSEAQLALYRGKNEALEALVKEVLTDFLIFQQELDITLEILLE